MLVQARHTGSLKIEMKNQETQINEIENETQINKIKFETIINEIKK